MWSSGRKLSSWLVLCKIVIFDRMNTNENLVQLMRETCVHLYMYWLLGWVALKQHQQQQQQ